MTQRVLRYTLVVRHPETDLATPLLAGEPVPGWAKDLVHDDDLDEDDDTDLAEGVEDVTQAVADAISEATDDAADNSTDESDGELAEVPYSLMSKKQLEDEVKARNAERDQGDVDYIRVDAPGNKPQLVAALKADDQVED